MTVDGMPVSTKWVAVDAATVIAALVPLILLVVLSVAVIDCVPAAFKVTVNVPIPFDSVASVGRVAWPSLLVKCTVPL